MGQLTVSTHGHLCTALLETSAPKHMPVITIPAEICEDDQKIASEAANVNVKCCVLQKLEHIHGLVIPVDYFTLFSYLKFGMNKIL